MRNSTSTSTSTSSSSLSCGFRGLEGHPKEQLRLRHAIIVVVAVIVIVQQRPLRHIALQLRSIVDGARNEGLHQDGPKVIVVGIVIVNLDRDL
jgi:hypothetical protein